MPGAPLVAVGRVRRAHGIHGELAVELLTDAPDAVFAPGRRLHAGDAKGDALADPDTGEPIIVQVSGARPFQDGILLTIESLSTRTDAERWRGRHFLAPIDELAPPAEGEVYLHELTGMRVLGEDGAPMGEVRGWYSVPQGVVLEVATADGRRGDVPFNAAFVVQVDRPARSLTVRLPEGMLE